MYKIVLIEDTPEMQKLVQTNLTVRNYEVITASDGEQGLSLVRRIHPDLILLDIRLPGITGWEVLSTLKSDALLKDIPVIIMTASEGVDDSKQAIERGAAYYFSKPFDLHEFIARIGKSVQDKKASHDR